MKTRRFLRRTRVQASLEAVVEFHSDSRALKMLTPPPVFVQLHEVEALAEGSRAEFTLWLGPLPVRWTALHSDVDPMRGFTDTQVRGPFDRWVHRHTFETVSAQVTDVVDEIQACFGSGLLRGWLSRMMWIGLPIMFAYRGWATRKGSAKYAKEHEKGAKKSERRERDVEIGEALDNDVSASEAQR